MMPFFRRVDLSSRPLLLLCGGAGSGKTTLLAKSGLVYEYLYPGDSSTMSKHNTPQWFFSEKAVYVSIGGLEDMAQPRKDKERAASEGKKQTKKSRKKEHAAPVKRLDAFYAELKRNRLWRRRAIDGVLLAVDISDVIKSNDTRINEIAAELRGQANAVVSITGYKIPVYFIFSKSDKIEGFRELFTDKSVAAQMPCVGSLVHGDGSSKQPPPKELFEQQYKKVYDDLADACVLGVVNANRRELFEQRPGALNDTVVLTTRREPAQTSITGDRAAICRLKQEFLLAESKLSTFVEAFFGDYGRNTPQFGGFFFASSMTGAMGTGGSDKSTAFSSRVLLGEVIPGAKHRIREAGEGTLLHRVKKIGRGMMAVFLCIVAIILIPGSGLRDTLHIRAVKAELSTLFEAEPTLENQYAALSMLLRSYDFLQNKFIPPGRMIFRTDKACAAVRNQYLAAVREVLAELAVERLEASIMRRAERRGEPTVEERQGLYRSLEAYLLLTGGYPPSSPLDTASVAEIIKQSLKVAIGPKYNSIANAIQENVQAVIRFAADGFTYMPPNEMVINAAREQLTHTLRAETVYASTMESLRSPLRAVPIGRIAGKNEIVQYGREVSILYTRDGWEQTVYAALADASKGPHKNNWVTGPAKAPVDDDKLLPELAALYATDMRDRWLDFIRATAVNFPIDATAFAEGLEKLASQKSEIGRTLIIACSLATQPSLDVAIPEVSKKTLTTDIKGQVSGLTNKLRGNLFNLFQDIPDPFVEAKKTFGPIEEFLTGEGFVGYRNDLGELSKAVKQCAERGSFSSVFVPRGEGTLSQSRKNLARAYVNMPAEAFVVKRLLEAPLDHAAAVVAKAVSIELEEAWAGEVVKYYNERLVGRYPFDKNAPADVPYSDFEDFFKPQSGILWKHIDKRLSGLIQQTPNGWTPAATPLPIIVNDEALRCVNRADKIATAFFRNDGSVQHDITFSPFTSTFGTARFSIGAKTFDFSGGLPVTISRAPSGDETIVLRTVSGTGKDAGEIRFAGKWSLVRFIGAAKIEPIGRNRYKARWSINVQNIYTAHVTTIVQSNVVALFDESIAIGFDVPTMFLKR